MASEDERYEIQYAIKEFLRTYMVLINCLNPKEIYNDFGFAIENLVYMGTNAMLRLLEILVLCTKIFPNFGFYALLVLHLIIVKVLINSVAKASNIPSNKKGNHYHFYN